MSKSVRLSSSAAQTGRTRKTPSTISAGATKVQAVRWLFMCLPPLLSSGEGARRADEGKALQIGRRLRNCNALPSSGASRPHFPQVGEGKHGHSLRLLLRKQRPPLGQDHIIDLRVERVQSRIRGFAAAHDALRRKLHLGGDALPFGDLRRRLDEFELGAESTRMLVIGQSGKIPGAAPRGQVAGKLVETLLLLDPRKELDQLPRELFVLRCAEDREARPPRRTAARPMRTR